MVSRSGRLKGYFAAGKVHHSKSGYRWISFDDLELVICTHLNLRRVRIGTVTAAQVAGSPIGGPLSSAMSSMLMAWREDFYHQDEGDSPQIFLDIRCADGRLSASKSVCRQCLQNRIDCTYRGVFTFEFVEQVSEHQFRWLDL